jgi:hypothetical protein
MKKSLILIFGGLILGSALWTGCKKDKNSESCSDGIQNQGETGIDCGGPCTTVCLTCSDGIQNQGEEDIDCGGPCSACATPAMSASIDGVVWNALDTFFIAQSSTSGMTIFRIKGTSGSKSIDIIFSFVDSQASLQENVTYTDAPATGYQLVQARYYEGSNTFDCQPGSYQLKMTRIANNRATGTFKFTGVKSGVTHAISSGTLTRVKIN